MNDRWTSPDLPPESVDVLARCDAWVSTWVDRPKDEMRAMARDFQRPADPWEASGSAGSRVMDASVGRAIRRLDVAEVVRQWGDKTSGTPLSRIFAQQASVQEVMQGLTWDDATPAGAWRFQAQSLLVAWLLDRWSTCYGSWVCPSEYWSSSITHPNATFGRLLLTFGRTKPPSNAEKGALIAVVIDKDIPLRSERLAGIVDVNAPVSTWPAPPVKWTAGMSHKAWLPAALLYGESVSGVHWLLDRGAEWIDLEKHCVMAEVVGRRIGFDSHLLQRLLAIGAPVHGMPGNGLGQRMPIEWAVMFNNPAAVDVLLTHGAKRVSPATGQTLPEIAVSHNAPQALRALIEAGEPCPRGDSWVDFVRHGSSTLNQELMAVAVEHERAWLQNDLEVSKSQDVQNETVANQDLSLRGRSQRL